MRLLFRTPPYPLSPGAGPINRPCRPSPTRALVLPFICNAGNPPVADSPILRLLSVSRSHAYIVIYTQLGLLAIDWRSCICTTLKILIEAEATDQSIDYMSVLLRFEAMRTSC